MSSAPGGILFDLAVQYLVPIVIQEATTFAARQAMAHRTRPDPWPPTRPTQLRLLTPETCSTAANIMSYTPGRIRIRVRGLRGDLPRGLGLATQLRGMSGVETVCTNNLTGTVLVVYDPRETGRDDILAAVNAAAIPSANAQIPELGSRSHRPLSRRFVNQPRLTLVGA